MLYKITNENNITEEVNGKPLENDYGLDLFYFININGIYSITESTTGKALVFGCTLDQAIDNMHKAIKNKGIENIRKLIHN